ncbi:MAG TPA: VWA domain-containing protein [Blastocatellia bacterium]
MSFRKLFALLVIGAVQMTGIAAGSRWSAPDRSNSTARTQQEQQQKDEAQEQLKLSATLIQVPTIVTDHSGKFVADLTKNNFTVFEDGKRQEIGTFGAVKEPFNVVLVLDTSNSADDRLKAIQVTATSFVKKLSPSDRAMVITFDNEIRQLTDFTSDQEELTGVINNVEAGFGKLLYEAVDKALNELKEVDGRRAVVLLTDGVDLDSIAASNPGTIAFAEQVGASIYCIQFDTRWWVESNARKQEREEQSQGPSIYGADGRIPLPGGPMGGGEGGPATTGPHVEVEASGIPTVTVQRENGHHGTITGNLDTMYSRADAYLKGLSDHSGGKVYKTFTGGDTEKAFDQIIEELRNQYVIGYYPGASVSDGKYHKIKVQVDRKDLDVRARQGYRAEKQ